MKELDKIIKTEKELKVAGYNIENNIIKGVDFNCVGRFGNFVTFEIFCKDVIPYCSCNNIANSGYIFKAFVELFELTEGDGVRVSEIKNIPCRVVYDERNCRAVGIGDFMKDKFVLTEDLAKICN